jgi:hypothetical protein
MQGKPGAQSAVRDSLMISLRKLIVNCRQHIRAFENGMQHGMSAASRRRFATVTRAAQFHNSERRRSNSRVAK